METSITKLQNSQVKLSVVLDKDDLLGYVKEVENQLAAESKIEGFRQGKVPPDIIRKKYGEAKIREEALNLAVEKSLTLALAREDIRPLSESDFKIDENTPDKLSYHVTVTIFPEIKLGKYKGLEIKKQPITVEEKEIDKVIEDVKKMRATAIEVDRPVKEGDKVEVDFVVQLDGKVIEGGKSENHPLVIGQNSFAPGFEENIVGLKKDEQKQFELSLPTDYYQKTIAGKKVTIDVTVKKIEEQTLPELTNEFVKTLGKFETVDDLKNNLKEGLTMEKESKEKERVRLAILDKIIDQSECELPVSLVDRQLDLLIQDFDADLHKQGMELGLYLAHIHKTQDDLRKDWRPKAERQVKMSLITTEISKEEKIEVADEEIEQEFSALADQYSQAGKIEAFKTMDISQIKSRIYNLVLNEKVFDFLEKENMVA